MSVVQPSSELAAQTVWPVDRIKDHVWKIGSGVMPSGGAASYLDAGIPLLRSQNVHFDGLRLDDVAYIAEETHEEMSGTKLRARDVLLNITGASIGRCAFVPDGFGEGNVNQHVCIIRPAAKLNYKFLTYCLSAPWGQDQVFSSFTGASRQGLGQRDLGAIQVPLPPLPEQQRIAAYLDTSCAAIDAAVAAKRRQLETLDALASSIINRAVTRGCEEHVSFSSTGLDWFPEVPPQWRAVRFKSLFRLIYRYPTYFNIEYVSKGIAEVRGEALTADGFIETLPDERYISPETSAQFPKTQLELGDIVMSVRGTMGKIGLVEDNYVGANITANLLRLSPDKHRVTGEFLCWLMRSKYFNEALNSSAPQTTIKTITMPQLAKLRVALPPKPEQHKICNFLEAKVADVKRIASGIETQIATLTAYRKSLIHECVTGQRRVTEAEARVGRARRALGDGD